MKKTVKIQGESKITATGRHTNGNAKPVFCIDTGEVFASVTDAAESAGAKPTTMTWCCTGRQQTCKGKRYCFVSEVSEHISEMAELIRKAKLEKLRAQLEAEEAEYDQVVINLDLLVNANNAVAMA